MPKIRSLVRAVAALAGALALQTAYADYQIHQVAVPGATDAQLWGVNNAGTMVGNATFDGTTQAILVNGGGVSVIAAPLGAQSPTALGVSDSGAVILDYIDGATGLESAAISQNGTTTSFAVPGTYGVSLRGISADGRFVTGYFYDQDGYMRGFVDDLTDGKGLYVIPQTGDFMLPGGVNASGLVVGNRNDELFGTRVPFIYSLSDGSVVDQPYGGNALVAAYRGINDKGLISGWVEGSDGSTFAIVGSNGTFETLKVDGASSTFAYAVNDAGLVVGNFIAADGSTVGAFYATAVPEPASAALLLSGLLLIGARQQRRRRAD